MSEKAYAEQISGTVHNELVGTFDKSQTSNRTIEEVDCKINPNAVQINFTTYHKTECLAGFPPCKGLAELKAVSLEYVNWFNYRRISSKTKGMSPCEYREHTLAA